MFVTPVVFAAGVFFDFGGMWLLVVWSGGIAILVAEILFGWFVAYSCCGMCGRLGCREATSGGG